MRAPRQLVVVTGTPRSGTTVVGDVLGTARRARMLYEPFNVHVGVRGLDEEFPIPGAGAMSQARFAELVAAIAEGRYRVKPGVYPHDRWWYAALKRLTGSRTTVTSRLTRLDPWLETIVWKDPFVVLAAPALAALGHRVVVTVRNPWAVAASFRRLHWGVDLDDVAGRLAEAGGDASATAVARSRRGSAADAVVQAAAFWTMAHGWLITQPTTSGAGATTLRLLDMDAVVAEPDGVYGQLLEWCGLGPTARTSRLIRRRYHEATGESVPNENQVHVRQRDVGAVNDYWRGVLDPAEIELVDAVCGSTWAALEPLLWPPSPSGGA